MEHDLNILIIFVIKDVYKKIKNLTALIYDFFL